MVAPSNRVVVARLKSACGPVMGDGIAEVGVPDSNLIGGGIFSIDVDERRQVVVYWCTSCDPPIVPASAGGGTAGRERRRLLALLGA